MNNDAESGQRDTRGTNRRPNATWSRSLGTRGGSFVEYIMIAGLVAIAAIYGFKMARARENRVIAHQAKLIMTLDPTAPVDVDFTDPIFGEDYGAPFCNLQGQCSGPGQCFAKGTLVATETGLRPIETLREGDLIWSRDEEGGDFALRPVLRRYVTFGQQVIDLHVAAGGSGETIRATTGHPFWVAGRGWVSAAELSVDQELFSASGDSIHVAPTADPQLANETVYNLEIAEFHTYFVGHHGVWVHNATNGPTAPCQQPGYVPPPTGGTLDFAKQATSKKGKTFPLGGSYKSISDFRTTHNGYNPGDPTKQIGGEIHHMPAKDVWNDRWPGPGSPPFNDDTGPAIWLEKKDHEATASYGNSLEAQEYRQKQADLIAKGKICAAINMDIRDIRSIAGDKYEEGIKQMLAYVRSQGYRCNNPPP